MCHIHLFRFSLSEPDSENSPLKSKVKDKSLRIKKSALFIVPLSSLAYIITRLAPVFRQMEHSYGSGKTVGSRQWAVGSSRPKQKHAAQH
jgi:hypothetical protein